VIPARLTVLLAALVAAGCARAIFVPPSGPGVPVVGSDQAWAEATGRCRSAASYAATIRLSGRAGDQGIPTLTLEAAVTDAADIYLGARAAGRPIFLLAGEGGQAALWLRREHRVVHGTPEAIIDALAGVRIDPRRLLAVLAGCIARDMTPRSTSGHGRLVRVETPDAVVYLERRSGVWQTRAGEADGLLIEFARDGATLPSRIWIWSRPPGAPPARVEISLVEGEINGLVPRQVFLLPDGAASAVPMTIEELRASGTWRGGAEGGR
jgi:hypothetical protein